MELASFLKIIFNGLNKYKIPYAVLRNYENLPEFNVSNDIDILINKENLQGVLEILSQIEDVFIVDICKRTYVTNIYLYNISDKNKTSLQLDFIYEFSWKGFPYLKTQDVLREALEYKGFMVVSPYYEAVILFWTKYVFHGSIKDKYMTYIANTLVANKQRFVKQFSVYIDHTVTRGFFEGNNFSSQNSKGIKKHFLRYNTKAAPHKFIIGNVRHNLHEVYLRYTMVQKYLLVVPENVAIELIMRELSNTTSSFIKLSSKSNIFNIFRFLFQPVPTNTVFILFGSKKLLFIRKQYLFKSNNVLDYVIHRQNQLKLK